jgi:hypothetical protein
MADGIDQLLRCDVSFDGGGPSDVFRYLSGWEQMPSGSIPIIQHVTECVQVFIRLVYPLTPIVLLGHVPQVVDESFSGLADLYMLLC